MKERLTVVACFVVGLMHVVAGWQNYAYHATSQLDHFVAIYTGLVGISLMLPAIITMREAFYLIKLTAILGLPGFGLLVLTWALPGTFSELLVLLASGIYLIILIAEMGLFGFELWRIVHRFVSKLAAQF